MAQAMRAILLANAMAAIFVDRLSMSLMSQRKRNFDLSEKHEASRYTSDIFAMVGTVLLWIFWPSFNAVLASNDAYHRAIINTYISLLGSTVATFVVTSFFGE